VYQSHTSRLTELWSLPRPAQGLNTYNNNKSLFVASSWSHLYLLIKDARSFEHKVDILDWLQQKPPIWNSTTNLPVGSELILLYADRRTDKHDESNGRFSRLNANTPENQWLADRKRTAFLLQNQFIIIRKTEEKSSTNEIRNRYVVFNVKSRDCGLCFRTSAL